MQGMIEMFIKEVSAKNHIMQLVKNLDLCIMLVAGNERYYLYFQNHVVALKEDSSLPAEYHVKITGSQESFIQLFAGNIKLRQGVDSKFFEVSCPFRTLLVLESIFFLARPIPA